MTTCNTNNCSLTIGNFRVDNNKWGASGASQSISVNGNVVGFTWNNSAGGWNYPELVLGKNRNCGNNTWSGGPFPFTQSNLKSCSVDITYKFTQKPTVNSWWNFAFDIYWMNNTTSCDSGKVYNIMIWIHGLPKFAGNLVKDNISDGNNTWSYYTQSKAWPWFALVLKNRNNIPYEPVLNQEYSIRIDLKKLFDAVGGLNGNWYLPGIEFGDENSGSLGTTSGAVEISRFDIEVNGQTTGLGGTPPPSPILTSISPASATLQINTTQQFTALDQNNSPITTGIIWSNTGVGSINSSGLYSAGATTGTATVQVVQGTITKTAPVTVTSVSTNKFNVFDVILDNTTNKRGVIAMQDDLGPFTKDQACTEVCNRLGQI